MPPSAPTSPITATGQISRRTVSPSSSGCRPDPPPATSDHAEKRRRSREGCFQCRRKKRGCDQVHPRCGACTRTSIECTFPPRKWDDSLGRLVTVRQPNQRRKPRAPDQPVAQPPSATVDAVHGSAFPTPDSAVPTQVFTQQSQQFAPIDPCGMQDSSSLDMQLGLDSIPDIPFSFFADFFNVDASLFESADQLFGSASIAENPSSNMADHSSECPQNTVLDTATPMRGTSDESGPSSPMDLSGIRSVTNPRPTSARQQEAVRRASMEEMRAFWVELLQFYDSTTNDYYYSCSPLDRRLILDHIVGGTMTDVHLAASAYVCAAHRTSVLQQGGKTMKAAEWSARSRSFYHAARDMLADETASLIGRVGAAIDLRLGHIWQDDPLGAQELHAICSSFIHAALGPRPSFTISHLVEPASISLTTFIHTDVLQCVANQGRRTTFDIKVDPPPPNGQMGLRVHLGLPAEVLWSLSESVNLAAERENRLAGRGGISEEKIRQRAEVVERALDEWRPELRAGLSSGALMETVATQTMWREAARIFLYSTVFSLGILSCRIRTALEEFIRASDTLPDGDVAPAPERSGLTSSHPSAIEPIPFTNAGRACAWFIAAMCAITSDERAVCMMGLRSSGDERIYQDNAEVVRGVWDEVDRTGREVDWREWIRAKGACVVFL